MIEWWWRWQRRGSANNGGGYNGEKAYNDGGYNREWPACNGGGGWMETVGSERENNYEKMRVIFFYEESKWLFLVKKN
jgi:hypothetical protein